MKVFVTIIILGFPVALAFSWAFEITPEGIKRESEVTPDQSITAHTGRKIVGITVALAVIAAGLMIFQFLRPTSATKSTNEPGASGPISEKSVAVLPFDNLSDEKANAYFAEGIQDEILTRLSKIAALFQIPNENDSRHSNLLNNFCAHAFRSFISPELTRKVVQKNSHGSEMLYYVHAAIATYEMIFA
jgi:hypothetical protein